MRNRLKLNKEKEKVNSKVKDETFCVRVCFYSLLI